VTGYGPVEDAGRGDTDVVIGRQRSMGSGVIVDPDGFIITNAHVISGAQRVQVVVPAAAHASEPALRSLVSARGRTVEARIVGVASEVDLALLKIDLAGLPALNMANYDEVRQGQMVFAFGSPEGLRNSVTMGVVSAVARQPDADHPMVYIQTDAPINHGNSGGPLLNTHGEVIGVNSQIETGGNSDGNVGIGFAVPSNTVKTVVAQLLKSGKVEHAYLGVYAIPITPAVSRSFRLPVDGGLVVQSTTAGSGAAKAGVTGGTKQVVIAGQSFRMGGDVIVAADGKPVSSIDALRDVIAAHTPGDKIELKIYHGQQARTVTVTLGRQPAASSSP
jgi:serine protease Do